MKQRHMNMNGRKWENMWSTWKNVTSRYRTPANFEWARLLSETQRFIKQTWHVQAIITNQNAMHMPRWTNTCTVLQKHMHNSDNALGKIKTHSGQKISSASSCSSWTLPGLKNKLLINGIWAYQREGLSTYINNQPIFHQDINTYAWIEEKKNHTWNFNLTYLAQLCMDFHEIKLRFISIERWTKLA